MNYPGHNLFILIIFFSFLNISKVASMQDIEAPNSKTKQEIELLKSQLPILGSIERVPWLKCSAAVVAATLFIVGSSYSFMYLATQGDPHAMIFGAPVLSCSLTTIGSCAYGWREYFRNKRIAQYLEQQEAQGL